ncbi:hypothetical protein [Mycobacterium malmoense]|nr:hypothetical protein [Mycobacterium malmoense]
MADASAASRCTWASGGPGTRGRNGAIRIPVDQACLTPEPVLL